MLKRTVYGGGGIMPDIFIPIDTTRYTEYHRKIVAQGVVNKVIVKHIEKNRDKLKKKYSSFDKFYVSFNIDEKMLEELKEDATAEGITFNEEQFNKSKDLISLQLKALIARDLWSMNEYYRIMDAENESLQKAIQLLNTPGAYEKIIN
jgi:carboxyl-terminal processing protease